MKLHILSVPDCPNVALLRERLAEVVSGRENLAITTEIVETAEEALLARMPGSPSLLVDGVDPFAEPGQVPSLSCRLYRDEHGYPAGAPSAKQLAAVLVAPTTAVAEPDCCSPVAEPVAASLNGLLTWRARRTPSEPATHALHQGILSAFAATGAPPSDAALRRLADTRGAAVGPTLALLHDADSIRLDAAGGIAVAYPFSTTPTRHQFRLSTGVEGFAMCAIDALGIPAMLHTDATLTSIDPLTQQRVTVTVRDGQYAWDPPDSVVFYSSAAGDGPSADVCCNDLNSFAGRDTAQRWISTHAATPGLLLDASTAERLAQDIFGALMMP